MSIITLLAPPALAGKLDLNRCMKMCLIHDMAESLVGDITPDDNVPKKVKSKREEDTMDFITKNLLGDVYGGGAGAELKAIWKEYEDSETLESRFVHDVDKMELLLQMFEYEKRSGGEIDLSEFLSVRRNVKLKEVNEWADQLMADREAFWEEMGREKGITCNAKNMAAYVDWKKKLEEEAAEEARGD